jgi:hypothetical protein
MWTSAMVKLILSPYFALEYIDKETRAMDDPSDSRIVHIRDEIIIKVPEKNTPEIFLQNSAMCLFLNKYTIFLDKL